MEKILSIKVAFRSTPCSVHPVPLSKTPITWEMKLNTTRLAGVMASQGITRSSLAERAGLTRPTLRRALAGEAATASCVGKIASALSIHPGQIADWANT